MSESVERILMEDPSEYRPEFKDKKEFRDFSFHTVPDRVIKTYKAMHTNQTYEFAKKKLEQWTKFDHAEMTIMEALEQLNGLVDESDPDVDVPNSMHAFQTAEASSTGRRFVFHHTDSVDSGVGLYDANTKIGLYTKAWEKWVFVFCIRKNHPDKEWFHVAGLIHDVGKLLALWGEPQWCVVGDTFPVGCAPAKSIVFDAQFFEDNEDLQNEKMNTKFGVYSENCGLENVIMSWGHDEYMYRVLRANTCNLPEEALYVIRFHSFYPWHTGGDYYHLCNNKDLEMLSWVQEFSKFDLYTKCPDIPDVDELMTYYSKLIEKYVPGKLKW